MKKLLLKTALLTIASFLITSDIFAYVYIQRNGGSILGYYKTVTEDKSYDPLASDYRYSLWCADPGWKRCRFPTLGNEAHLTTNTGNIITGEGIFTYSDLADEQIANGNTSGTIITEDGIVIVWNVNSNNVTSIWLYSYTEAQSLGIVQ